MTATQDLQDVSDAIDGALHGWLYPDSIKGTTVKGRECLQQVTTIRKKLYDALSETQAIQVWLDTAKSNLDGSRNTNELTYGSSRGTGKVAEAGAGQERETGTIGSGLPNEDC